MRKAMFDHVTKECEDVEVPCEYINVGCCKLILRKNMKNHMETKMTNHMSLLLSHTQNKMRDCENQVDVLTEMTRWSERCFKESFE